MTTRGAAYRQQLARLKDWDGFLQKESGLPGPRANLELVQTVADLGHRAQFERWVALDAAAAPANTPAEYLPVCGAVGLGRLLAEGDLSVLPELRRLAGDARWRVREGVAMGLQRWGEADMGALIRAMQVWTKGTWLEQRAAAAALCEPRLLGDARLARPVLKVLDPITANAARAGVDDRRAADFKALRKALGYCWSVAVAAWPEPGRPALETWLAQTDRDVRWIVRENLKKDRLRRMDAAWVARWTAALPPAG
jgi:hypothetical protein